ncbi:MAG: hypothetical protein Tsb0032_29020 [Kiloniellaceae bacterium]
MKVRALTEGAMEPRAQAVLVVCPEKVLKTAEMRRRPAGRDRGRRFAGARWNNDYE